MEKIEKGEQGFWGDSSDRKRCPRRKDKRRGMEEGKATQSKLKNPLEDWREPYSLDLGVGKRRHEEKRDAYGAKTGGGSV